MCVYISAKTENALIKEADNLYGSKVFYLNNGIYSINYNDYKYVFDEKEYAIVDNKIQNVKLSFAVCNNILDTDSINTKVITVKQELGYHCNLFYNIDNITKYFNMFEPYTRSEENIRLLVKFKNNNIKYVSVNNVNIDTFKIVTDIKIYLKYFKFSKAELENLLEKISLVKTYINNQKREK